MLEPLSGDSCLSVLLDRASGCFQTPFEENKIAFFFTERERPPWVQVSFPIKLLERGKPGSLLPLCTFGGFHRARIQREPYLPHRDSQGTEQQPQAVVLVLAGFYSWVNWGAHPLPPGPSTVSSTCSRNSIKKLVTMKVNEKRLST